MIVERARPRSGPIPPHLPGARPWYRRGSPISGETKKEKMMGKLQHGVLGTFSDSCRGLHFADGNYIS
jgi:hypothetical protein